MEGRTTLALFLQIFSSLQLLFGQPLALPTLYHTSERRSLAAFMQQAPLVALANFQYHFKNTLSPSLHLHSSFCLLLSQATNIAGGPSQ